MINESVSQFCLVTGFFLFYFIFYLKVLDKNGTVPIHSPLACNLFSLRNENSEMTFTIMKYTDILFCPIINSIC